LSCDVLDHPHAAKPLEQQAGLFRAKEHTPSSTFSGERFEYRLRSGSLPCVKMMQSADLGNFDHPAKRVRLDRSANGRIFVELAHSFFKATAVRRLSVCRSQRPRPHAAR